jgi:putative ABC transport system permease protein
MIGRNNFDVNEISVLLEPGVIPEDFRDSLLDKGFGEYSSIQVWYEAIPQFLDQIKTTFGLLGNLIGGIGLIVASITIFIVIFVNIVTRRKFIGILKGIGISPEAIEISYVFQSIFYAVLGSISGMLVVFLIIQPFIAAHPIDFPFSDGILVATFNGSMIRAGVLLVATVLAGYIPARLIVRKNTLDAILGR